ncbi:MAG: toxin-antitoxin system YwqK family antitoxin [Winogradskyella sp.]|uniref:toxin-antitoxin system YwqK family antitoxin n=1 Tax=Winogradskyella sp. TaxID=1883156 RepID=UPI0025EB7863|nr:toxin-antitoxin system YwqK family antitoxin [Winogradskyella sp.]NRB58791.1 toxin-antitoxin system YwqK family antitoxin [Winogradskyella sp.]
MIKHNLYLVFIFTITLTVGFAQKSVNQYDKNGKRHGLWTKDYHGTDQKRYEGTFYHGKEIDTFNYYTLHNGKSVLSAIKVFNDKDSISHVTFYTSTKKVISEGQMNGRKYIGKWIFYHKNSTDIMIEEHYNDNGQLHGKRKVFYKNGIVAEETSYVNGKLDGMSIWYTEKDKILKKSMYKNDMLNGESIYYDSEGYVTSQGNYVDNRKEGIWKYYKNGKIKKEIDHTNNIVIKKYE